jgi:arsenate reductase (glutaredoxin)
MTMIKIYHNPRCRKSRAGLQHLESKKLEFEVIDYLKHPLTASEIEKLISFTGLEAEKLLRKQEEHYKTRLKGKKLSTAQWAIEIASNPKLLQRPIVLKGNKAVLADPPENMDGMF